MARSYRNVTVKQNNGDSKIIIVKRNKAADTAALNLHISDRN